MGRVQLLLLVITQVTFLAAYQPYQSRDNTLAKKCERMNTETTAAFYGRSCFATTKQKYSTKLKDWFKLHAHCQAIMGYRGRMAFIRSREQIDALQKGDVIEGDGRYFIGARQEPPSNCGENLCKGEDHKKDWYFIDADGKQQGKLNDELWLHGEPNNAGDNPPEHIVTLENLKSTMLGFNDGNGEAQHFPILCEYEDILECPENYSLIKKTCYRAFPDAASPVDAQSTCEKDGGSLPSVHNDQLNSHLAVMAQLAKKVDYSKRRGSAEEWGPFLIGLQWKSGAWTWTDGSKTDYFRWYSHKGGSMPVLNKPSDGYAYAVLQTTTNANSGEGGFAYWSVLKETDKVPFFCQTQPKVFMA